MHRNMFKPADVKLLLVDDNAFNLEVIHGTLESAGYEKLTSVSNPLKLSSILDESSFDLILLDINMPIMDGFGVLSLIQQMYAEHERPPVIMLTAQDDTQNRIKAFDAGASDYITKPFNRKELLKRVSLHIDNWVMKQKLLAEKQTLEEKVRERTQAMQEAQFEIVYRLGRASEYRDNETGNHVRRVSMVAEAIARAAGYDDDFCRLIQAASPMHDVGKIGISDLIMLKPGGFTDEEFSIMQSHVTIGGEILANSKSEVLQLAHEITLTHHEKYNGKGYPEGLVGEEIPVSGRIVAIADVFDALTSERPYKKAWPIDKAVALIVREKGEHFDPVLVDAFVSVIPEVEKINKQYQD